MSRLISAVIPVHNEAAALPRLCDALRHFFDTQTGEYDVEVLFVDDGSSDETLKLLEDCAQDHRFKYLSLSRRFGKEAALTAGLHAATGEAVITMDGDLQHPVAVISEFLQAWQQGAEVVVGVRKIANHAGMGKRIGSFFFYKILQLITETDVVPQSTDFRLLDRRVVAEFNKLTDHNRLTRGLVDWLGFKRRYVYFTPGTRVAGVSQFGYIRLTKLALSSFVSHSLVPLKVAGYLGLVITFFSGILWVFIFINKYILGDPWHLAFTGLGLLAVLIVFLIGIVLSCLGLIALYIGNIHTEVAGRPLYVIRKKKL